MSDSTTRIEFQPMRYNADNTLTPSPLAPTQWDVPTPAADALLALTALPVPHARNVAQYEVLTTPAVQAPANVLGYAYDHPFTLRRV